MSRIPRTGSVCAKIDGLTLSRYREAQDDSPPVYEVGFLRSEGHEFTICYTLFDEDSKPISSARVAPPQEGSWRLAIIREGKEVPADAQLFQAEGADFDRLELSLQHGVPGVNRDDPIFMDFRWVLDLESGEFPQHPPRLELVPHRLHPTVQFTSGLVYNEKMSELAIKQSFDGGKPQAFGLISDIVGIDMDAQPGDEVILYDVDTGEGAFRILIGKGQTLFVNFNNTPPEEDHTTHLVSHFQRLYEAFNNVKKEYDLAPLTTSVAAPHHDEVPHDHDEHGAPHDHDEHGAPHDHDEHGVPPVPGAPHDHGAVAVPAVADIVVCVGGRGGGGAPLCGNGHLSAHANDSLSG